MKPNFCEQKNSHHNVVLVITDQQRADLCAREGFPLDVSPFVDKLAAENAWFNRAYTTVPASVTCENISVHRALSKSHPCSFKLE